MRRGKFLRILAYLPLRWRLACVSFGLLAVLLLAVGFLISITEEDALLTSQANLLHSNADLAARFGLKSSNISVLPENATPMSEGMASQMIAMVYKVSGENRNIGVSVLSTRGRLITNGLQAGGAPRVELSSEVIKQWMSTRKLYLLVNDEQGQRELVVLQPVEVQEEVVSSQSEQVSTVNQADQKKKVATNISYSQRFALLQFSSPTVLLDQSIQKIRLMLVLGIVGALGIAAALTLPLIRGALRPLVEMERVSSSIADGEFSLRLKEPETRDEVGRMAYAFNSMVARLEETFVRQKRFVGDVSHELRTPLTALGGSLEMLLLEADNGDVEASRRLMRGMYAEVERMQRLVADLLVLARLDEGQIKLREQPVNMHVLLSEIGEQAQQLAEGQKIDCCFAGEACVCGDEDQLRRVLLNIVENALKFTPADGCITLNAREDGAQHMLVEIGDTGMGMAEEDLPHVFDRFYRADAARTRSARQRGGSGLGLSIAQGLVNAHRGTISIKSAPGCGTRVTIVLPLLRGPE